MCTPLFRAFYHHFYFHYNFYFSYDLNNDFTSFDHIHREFGVVNDTRISIIILFHYIIDRPCIAQCRLSGARLFLT
jgi:hypothetical protein